MIEMTLAFLIGVMPLQRSSNLSDDESKDLLFAVLEHRRRYV